MLQVCFECYGSYTTDSVYQWDLNRKLSIKGLNYDSAPTIHFSNKKSTEALVVQSTIEDGVIYCDVPNILLQEPYDIVGYVCESLDQELKTHETIRIPVKTRIKPADYIYNDNVEILTYYSLMSEITSVKVSTKKAINSMDESKASKAELNGVKSEIENTIDNEIANIENDITKVENEIASERARIDQLVTSPEMGEGDFEKELEDIRIDTNGTTHGSAGGAVREQIRTLNSKIEDNISTLSSEIDYLENGLYEATTFNPDNLIYDSEITAAHVLSNDNNAIPCTEIKGFGNLKVNVVCRYNNGVLAYPHKLYLFEKINDNLKCVHIEELNFTTENTDALYYKWNKINVNYKLEEDSKYLFSFDCFLYITGTSSKGYYGNIDFTNIGVNSEISLSGKPIKTGGVLLGYSEIETPKFYGYVDEKINEISQFTPTINILGDSITAQNNYTNALISKGYTINNYGVSGTTISNRVASNTFYNRVSSMTEDCDFIFMLGGTNDWGLSCELGTKNDTEPTTFYGGLYTTLNALRTKYPTKSIVVSTILQRNWTNTTNQSSGIDSNENGNSIEEFNNAIEYMAKRFGCFIVDGFSFGMCLTNLSTYTSDNLHLNALGGQKYAEFLDNEFRKIPIYEI